VLGGWPLSQLTEGVGDSSCLLLSGVVAVLGCCIVTARHLQGMARVRSGQAPAWPLSSDRSARRGLQDQAGDFAFTRHLLLCSLPYGLQSCLRPEGRARTLRRPSPDLSPPRALCTFSGIDRRQPPRLAPARGADALNAALPRKALAAQASSG
jgi:hypothetical protein